MTAALKGLDKQTALQVVANSKLDETLKRTVLFNQKFYNSVEDADAALGKFKDTTDDNTKNVNGFSTSVLNLKNGFSGLWQSIKSNPLSAIATGATVALTVINLITTAVKKHREEIEKNASEALETYQSEIENLKSIADQYQELTEKYKTLSTGVNSLNENVSLSNEEYDEYLEVCKEIGDMFPDLIQGYDDQGRVILSCKGNVEELTQAYQDMQKAANNAILASGGDVFKSFKHSKGKIESQLNTPGMEYVANNYSRYDIFKMLRDLANSSDIDSAVSEYFGKTDAVSQTINGQLIQALNDAGLKQRSNENGKDFLARALRENMVELNAYFSQFDQEISTAIQGTKSLSEAYLGNLLLNNGDHISDGVKQVAQTIVSDFDYEFLRTFNNESEIYSYIDSLVNSLSGLTGDQQKAVQIAFQAKAAFNGGEISIGEYESRIAGIEDVLSELPENVQSRIKLALNDSDYTKKVNKIKDGRSSDFKSWIDSLTKDDFEIVFDLVTNGGFNDLSSLQAQLARIKETSDNLNDALKGMAGQFSDVASAKSKYDEAMNAGEKNDNFKSMAEAYKKLNEEVTAGTTNSNSFWAAAEYLFGSDKLEQWGYSVESITSAMQGLSDVFSDADTGGYGFLDKLYALSTNGSVISDTGDLLAQIEKLDDGSWKFNIDALNLDALADKMDMSKEAILSCIQALSMYGDIDFSDMSEVLSAIQKIGMSTDAFQGTVINLDSLKSKMEELGYTSKDIYDLVNRLQALDGVTLFDINSDTDTLKQNLIDIGIAEENAGKVQINSDSLIGLMNTLSFTKDQAKDLFGELSKSGNVSFTDANGEAITLKDSLDRLDKAKFDGVTSEFDSVVDSADTAIGKVNDLQSAIDNLHGTSVAIDLVENWTSGSTPSLHRGSSGKLPSHASGTGGAPGGPSLTGENGEELVQSGDSAYFVGSNGPEIVNLHPGDTVYNAEQTRKIKAGQFRIRGSIPSFASGTSGRLLRTPKKFAVALDGSSGNSISGAAIAKKLKGYTGSSSESSSNTSSGSSSGGGSSGSSSSSDKSSAYDWIKVAIERIETAVIRLKTTATSAFKAIAPKLNASYEEISKINDEIAIHEKGYARYMEQANSVGLDAGLAEKVRNGTIDINEYDSDTQSLITDYKKWYDAAQDCSTAVQTLHENLASLYEDNFDKVQTEYENQAKLLSHLESTYNSGMDLLDAKGYMVSASYYAALQDYEKQNIAILNQELSDLTTKFSEAMASGEIEEYSDAWYSMQDSINGVKESLADANVQLANYAKEMRQVEWDRFDYVQDRISQITQESDFLIDLLSNSDLYTDKGQFNDKGRATLGLRAQNYNVYMAQADQYAKEILALDRDIANDPYNTDLIERREELLKLQQDSISSAEDEKQAIVSLVQDGIDKELESLKKLTDAYTDSLDSAKNLYDYQKKVTDKSSEIASLQKQLAAYSNDTSEETRSKIQKLQVELATAKEDLQETRYEQYITDQKKLLDNLYADYEEILNQRLDNVDSLIGDMIDVVNENSGSISDTINQAASDVGYTLTDNLRDIWNGSFDGVVTKYGDQFDTQLTSVNQVLNSIQAYVAAMAAASDSAAGASASGAKTSTSTIPTGNSVKATTPAKQSPAPSASSAKQIVVGGKINAGSAKIYAYPGGGASGQYFSGDPIYTVLAESNGYLQVRHHNLSSGVTGWFKKSDVKAYRTGGLVDYTGLAKVDGTPGKPELMLNAADTQNFLNLRDALRSMAKQDLSVNSLSGFQAPDFTGIVDISKRLNTATSGVGAGMGDTTFGDVIIQIDHVEDYNDFVNQLKNDKQFEKMVQAMTVDRVAGKSGFAKYSCHWKK